eukprot:tig00000310_g23962.t1
MKQIIALALFGLLAIASAQTASGPTFRVLTLGADSTENIAAPSASTSSILSAPAIVEGFEGACWGTGAFGVFSVGRRACAHSDLRDFVISLCSFPLADTQGNLVIAGGLDKDRKILNTIYGYRALDKDVDGAAGKAGVFVTPTVTGDTMPAHAFASGAMFGNRLFCTGGYTAETVDAGSKTQTINTAVVMISTQFASYVGQAKRMTAVVSILQVSGAGSNFGRFDHRSIISGSIEAGVLKATIHMIGGLTRNTGEVMTAASGFVGVELSIPVTTTSNTSSSATATYKSFAGLETAPTTFTAGNKTETVPALNGTAFPGAFFAYDGKAYLLPGTKADGAYIVGANSTGFFAVYTPSSNSWAISEATGASTRISYGSVAASGNNIAIVGGFIDKDGTTGIHTVTIAGGKPTGIAVSKLTLGSARSGSAAFFDNPTDGSLYVVGGAGYKDTSAPQGTLPITPYGQKFLSSGQILLKGKSEATTVGAVKVGALFTRKNSKGQDVSIFELFKAAGLFSTDLTAYGGANPAGLMNWKAAVLDPWIKTVFVPYMKGQDAEFVETDFVYTVALPEETLRRRARSHGRRAHGTVTQTQISFIASLLGAETSCANIQTRINSALTQTGSPLSGLSLSDVNSVFNTNVCKFTFNYPRPVLSAAAATSPMALLASAILALAALLFAL